jgi:hypothetical protein
MGGLKNRHYIETEPVNITLPSTAEDVKNVMGQAIVDVRTKKLDPRIAMALTSMSRVLLEAFQTADLQKRMERLKQARATAERSHEPLSLAADSGSD